MKQVIVLRKDLNMRKGKMVAQGSHASLGAYLAAPHSAKEEWMHTGQTKICVGVDSEAQLIEIYQKALNLDIPTVLITDAGHTEFDGPTKTAVCLGPWNNEEIDKITGELKLL